MNDYRRPAPYQINHFYKCTNCKSETEYPSDQQGPSTCRSCGGEVVFAGESYPASSKDWDEERDNVNDGWHNRNRRY